MSADLQPAVVVLAVLVSWLALGAAIAMVFCAAARLGGTHAERARRINANHHREQPR